MADDPADPDTFFGEIVTPPAADEPVTFDELKDHLTPPGTDKDKLWSALKAAQVTGGQLPRGRAPDISVPAGGIPEALKAALPALSGSAPLPADPFTQADASDIALGEMFHGMIRGGIPKDSAERIIGHMLADMGPRGGSDDGTP